MRATGAEVIKVAVMAHRLVDNLALLPVTQEPSATVVIGMGAAGLPSRILAERFQSSWTYSGDAVAPGQIPADRMVEELSFRRIGANTALYGVVGRPVMHSLSPVMHNAAFEAAGVDAVYVPLAAADFDDFLNFAAEMGIVGASVTAPFKMDALAHASTPDAASQRVGSVNTLRRSPNGWEATNTDVDGFLAPLQANGIDLRGRRVTVLGAGGAARAVVAALEAADARVAIAARCPARAAELAEDMGCDVTTWPPPPHTWDVLVHATPVGTAPDSHATPLPDFEFTGELVYDLVYNPAQTCLLRDAARAGCRTIGGLHMLVAQAQRQFEWWTGRTISSRVMYDAALNALMKRGTSARLEIPQ
jgi:3-dehydroquinate dehydratase/shikimate dehydrogenase